MLTLKRKKNFYNTDSHATPQKCVIKTELSTLLSVKCGTVNKAHVLKPELWRHADFLLRSLE